MKLHRFFVFLSIIIIISLLYVQMQVEIVKLAYEGRAKEAQLKELLDTKTVLVYNINKLESAHNIGYKLLCSGTDLKFTAKDQIAALRLPIKLTKSTSNPGIRKVNFFTNLFSLSSEAEATEKIK